MKFKINKFKTKQNPYRFTPSNVKMASWMLEEDWEKFMSDYPDLKNGSDFFIKIECLKKCSDFIIYTKLAKLPNDSLFTQVGDGFIWLPQELLPIDDLTDNQKDFLEVSVVDTSSFYSAETVTLKVSEDDVSNWSEDEFIKATFGFKSNKLTYIGQKLFFDPKSKNVVVAEVTKVNGFNIAEYTEKTPFNLTDETIVTIDGKPVNTNDGIDFSKIGGQNKVIQELREIIQLPINFPEYFEKFEIDPPKGILLYGPPGNGKTMIASALAKNLGASFINIDLSDALQKYKGAGEYNLELKFEEAASKRNAVIFIDEIDAIASIRKEESKSHEVSLVGKLLTLMDGIKPRHRIIVIGATNRLYAVDPALRRPGRFDKEIEVPLPDNIGRYDILKKYINLKSTDAFDSSINEEYLKRLAEELDGFSGADIKALFRETTISALREYLSFDQKTGKASITKSINEIKISPKHFTIAKERIVPTLKRPQDAN